MTQRSSYISGLIGKKAIITTDQWFYGQCGKQYRAVYGTVYAVEESEKTLGVKTNSKSTSWYVRIGKMIVAGCQIHYVVAANSEPPMSVQDVVIKNGKVKGFNRPSHIYNADE